MVIISMKQIKYFINVTLHVIHVLVLVIQIVNQMTVILMMIIILYQHSLQHVIMNQKEK